MASFELEYTPKTDLIYGIGVWISCYVIHYQNPKKRPDGWLSDTDFQEAHRLKEEGFFAINTYNVSLNNAQVRKEQGKVSDYMKAIDASLRSSPGNALKLADRPAPGDIAKLRKSNINLDPSDVRGVREAAYDMAVRRSSKFGIEYVAKNLDGKIHYILDGIDIGKVITKDTVTNKGGYTKTPICSSELRFLFRNWQAYKGNVQFWKNYDHCSPPWYDSRTDELWAAYALARILKGYARRMKLRSEHWEILVPLLEKIDRGGLSHKDVEGLWRVASADKGSLSVKLNAGCKPTLTATQFVDLFHSLPVDLVNAVTDEVDAV
jgi:hypothetical protein